MNKLYLVLIVFILTSCKKKDDSSEIIPDNRCTNLIIDDPNIQILSDQEVNEIKYLFKKNKLNIANLQFINYNYIGDIKHKIIGCFQYVNNLKLFTDRIGFDFDENDSLVFTFPKERVLTINISNSQKLSKAYVRGVFIKEFEKDNLYLNIYNNKDTIENGCIDIEFGYYNLNSGTGSQIENYTTAWYLKPKDNDYPMAYIDDNSGKIIYYFDGIIINKK